MTDLSHLYHQAILDHYRNPRNMHALEHFNRHADGFNPLCGDRLSIYIAVESGILHDISFVGTGCAISIASASLMTDFLKGKTESAALALFDCFHCLLTASTLSQPDMDSLEGLTVFAGLREYPSRIKCATLAWHTLRAALAGSPVTVATE